MNRWGRERGGVGGEKNEVEVDVVEDLVVVEEKVGGDVNNIIVE